MRVLYLLTLAILAIGNASAQDAKATLHVTFCNFSISEHLKRANYSSVIIYTFEFDENGKPVNVSKLKDDFVGMGPVRECLAEWRIEGPADDGVYRVVFSWKHGVGWVKMAVTGPDYRMVVNLSGERAPYCRNSSGSIP